MSNDTSVVKQQSFVVYLGKQAGLSPLIWGGKRARLDAQTENFGGISTTNQFAINGGTEPDSTLQDQAGTVDLSLILKRVRNDKRKTELKTCFWIIDHRVHCGDGSDRDDPFAWEEIDRYTNQKTTTREKTPSTWEGNAESTVTFSMQGLNSFDIYRQTVGFASPPEGIPTAIYSVTDLSTGYDSSCGSCRNITGDALIYGVTTAVAAASPFLMINEKSGGLINWTQEEITEWSNDIDAVWGRGSTVIMVSSGEAGILRSDDKGVTRSAVTNSFFAANPPIAIDGLHQGNIVVSGENGFVYKSQDGGRVFDALDMSGATTEDLTQVRISRQSADVIWAAGTSGTLVKSENGGKTGFVIATPTAENIMALSVINDADILILDAVGDLFQSEDGGETWILQSAAPSMVSTVTQATIKSVGVGVIYMIATDGVNSYLWRNVDKGADGFWYFPENGDDLPVTVAQGAGALTPVDVNSVVAGGGTATDPLLILASN